MSQTALTPIQNDYAVRLPASVVAADFRELPLHELRDQLRLLVKYRRLAFLAFGITLGLVVLVLLFSPRLYTSSTKLLVARQAPIQLRLDDSRVLNVGDIDAGNIRDNFNATQLAALQSRDLAARVIRMQKLREDPFFLRPTSIPGWFASVLRRLNVLRPLTTSDLVDLYTLRYLSVEAVRGTDLLQLDFTTPDPALSARLARAHIDAFKTMNAEARHASDDNAKSFLADQIEESEKRVDASEKVLRTFAAEHPNVAVNQEQNSIAQRINELSTQVTAAESERMMLQSRYDLLKKPGSDVLPYFLDQPGVQKLRLQLLDLRTELAARDQRLGPHHPTILEFKQQRKELENQLQGEVANELKGIQSKYDAARLREERLGKQLVELERSATALREVGARYDTLKNEAETARKLHESLLQQEMGTTVNSQLVASNVRVIETPEVPPSPSQPRVVLDLLLGILAGLVAALGSVFGYAYFDSSVKSSNEIEEFLKLPTLATIPRLAHAAGNGASANGAHPQNGSGDLVVLREPWSQITEAFRTMKTAVLFPTSETTASPKNGARPLNGSGDLAVLREPWSQIAEAFRMMKTAVLFSASEARPTPKVILVTSALAGEGKSFGSLNLAATLAEAGARVLLVDADLRHGRCHAALGVPNDRGLSSVLAGKLGPNEVILPAEMPRLFFVPAGPRPANPAELVASGAIRRALEDWRAGFHFVVIDSPPALPVSDAVELAQEADGVVLVVKADETPIELVRRVRDRLVRTGAQILGVVVNNVGPGWADVYDYDGYRTPEEPVAEAERA